jgi:DNA-binding winged helix-turn-helix (wHTH) protein
MDRIYPDGRVVSDRTIDSHVKKLRKKLSPLLAGQEVVHSVYGVGYRFELTDSEVLSLQGQHAHSFLGLCLLLACAAFILGVVGDGMVPVA